MLPLDVLLRPMTEDEVFERMLQILRDLDMPVDSWRTGAAIRVIIRVCARLYAGFTVIMAAFIASGFLETATGDWLTKLAHFVYGVDRRPATFAKEMMQLTNAGSLLFDGNLPGTVTVFNPTTLKAYRNTTTFDLDAFETKLVEFEAVEIGSASTSAAGTITGLETHFTGVTVVNLKAFIGLDEEKDPELRQACKDKLGALSVRGPRTAYAYAIRQAIVEDGANLNRWQISRSSSTGKVHAWLASPSGSPLTADVDSVKDKAEKYARPDTVTFNADAAVGVTVSRDLIVWVQPRDGVKADDVASTILTALAREAASYPIGGIAKAPAIQGKLYSGWFEGVAKEAWPDVFDVEGAGSDVNLAEGEVVQLFVTVDVRFSEAA